MARRTRASRSRRRDSCNLQGRIGPAITPTRSPNCSATARIAPLWADLNTYGPDNDIFVDTSTANQITIRWNATNDADDSPVNFAVTLLSNGDIRFDYGPGNTNLTPTIGISRGDGRFYVLSQYNAIESLDELNSVQFALTPGLTYADIGAFEFQGNSNSTASPLVTGTSPGVIQAGGSTDASFGQFQVDFSKALNCSMPARLRPTIAQGRRRGIRQPGRRGLCAHAAVRARFNRRLAGHRRRHLPPGDYRFTVLRQLARPVGQSPGWQRDGNPGSDFVRAFTIIPPVADLALTIPSGRQSPARTSRPVHGHGLDTLGPDSATDVQVQDLLPSGVTFHSFATTNGSYNPNTGIWAVGRVSFGGVSLTSRPP